MVKDARIRLLRSLAKAFEDMNTIMFCQTGARDGIPAVMECCYDEIKGCPALA